MSNLYIVATPIGNLEDVTLRALRILKEVDYALCEDTRVTKKLLDYYKIKTKTISYHQHSNVSKVDYILRLLKEGNDLALVSDSGTPGISDPGGKLVAEVVENLGNDIKIESVSGPSAVTTALSISGFPTDKFIFMGFPPHKKGRQKFIKEILENKYTTVLYESKHRIIKLLEELNKFQKKELEIVVCRELSKMHESIYRGDVLEILNELNSSSNNLKGEFVVIVKK
ncbi:16S rRNA (cytidine(1402)-2'-O)-methyltransferase [bacterium]|nr:16S rRNA (cytidine(1402)-2'-O)-methyltransferase [bacterium]